MKLREIVRQIIKESFADDILNKIKGDTHWYDILYYYLVKGKFYGNRWEKWINISRNIDNNTAQTTFEYLIDYAVDNVKASGSQFGDPIKIDIPNTKISFYVIYENAYEDDDLTEMVPYLIKADF